MTPRRSPSRRARRPFARPASGRTRRPPRAPAGAARRAALGIPLALLALAAAPGAGDAQAGSASPASGLRARLERALAHPGLRGARVGALVVRADDGATLFARDADRPLVPASNMKLLTALAALETFGPAHRFTTRVLADRAPDAEGAVGLLVVEGGGDPTLTSEQWWRLAQDLRLRGLRRVDGPLFVDGRAFDAERWHPAWGAVGARAYHAPVSALMANYGAFQVEVAPGPVVGGPAQVSVDPPVPYLRVRNRAHTRAPGTPAKLVVERAGVGELGETVVVSGAVPAGGEARSVWRSVARPERYAGAVLRMQLEAVGIPVAGPVKEGPAPAPARELLAFEGEPVGRIVQRFLKHSTNPVAEVLFKDLGRAAAGAPGSWANGAPALRASLERLGVATDGLVVVDGSGLSRDNRVAPRTLVDALRRGRGSFALGPELVAALPIAGEDGTLRERAAAAAGAVRAKTGLLDGVTALSGYAAAPEGELVFTVISNGHRRGDRAAMDALDAFAGALVAAD